MTPYCLLCVSHINMSYLQYGALLGAGDDLIDGHPRYTPHLYSHDEPAKRVRPDRELIRPVGRPPEVDEREQQDQLEKIDINDVVCKFDIILLYYIILHYIILYYIILYNIILCYIILYYIILFDIILLYYIMSMYAISIMSML